MKIIAFKIWYSNKVYESKTSSFEDWKDSPIDDVQLIVFYFDKQDGLNRPTRRMMSGCDYYGRTENDDLSQNFDDKTKVSGYILYGKWTTDENMKRIIDEAIDDYGEEWLYLDKSKIIVEELIIKKETNKE